MRRYRYGKANRIAGYSVLHLLVDGACALAMFGRFITEDEKMLKHLKESLASEHIREFIEKMKQLGFQEEETLRLIQDAIKGEH